MVTTRDTTTGPSTPSDEQIERARAIAASVPDPEIPAVTLGDLGILRSVRPLGDGIEVAITPTYTGCPATLAISLDVETALRAAGIANAKVRVVLSPPWTTDDITSEGRRKLREIGIAPPPPRSRGDTAWFSAPTVACPRCGSLATRRISEFGSTPCKAHWRCEACREPFDLFKCL